MPAIPSCIHCLLGSKPGIEVQRSVSFRNFRSSEGAGTQTDNSNREQCVLQQKWGPKPQSLGKQGFPSRAIRESFLEVVTPGLEYKFSRQRGDALCSCLQWRRPGEGWREASVDSSSLLSPPRGTAMPERVS